MKKTIMAAAAVSALVAAAPAAAQYQRQSQGQYQNSYEANGNFSARIGQLRTRLQTGVQSGSISRQEAQPLRQQLRQLVDLERQYSLNGLSGRERSDLQQRVQNLRQQIRYAEGRGYGQGQYDRDDDYGQGQYDRDDYGQGRGYDRVDRNNDGYDDRDYDRDGRWDDDYQQPVQRGGLGGLVDGLLGTGGLRVGQRATGNLYGVPYQYQNQYRDGSGYYYRSDGRNIYQIDARSQTVVRVHGMR